MTEYTSKAPDQAILDELHEALGEALTRWQHVERSLYLVTHCLIGASHEATSIVFFHIKSAESKLALTDKLCRQFLTQAAYQGAWRDLRKSLTSLIDLRNGMAHFGVVNFDIEELPKPRRTRFPIMLAAHDLDVSAVRDGTSKGLFLETVRDAGLRYVAASIDLIRFGFDHVPHWQPHIRSLPPNLQQHLQTFPRKKESVGSRKSPPEPSQV